MYVSAVLRVQTKSAMLSVLPPEAWALIMVNWRPHCISTMPSPQIAAQLGQEPSCNALEHQTTLNQSSWCDCRHFATPANVHTLHQSKTVPLPTSPKSALFPRSPGSGAHGGSSDFVESELTITTALNENTHQHRSTHGGKRNRRTQSGFVDIPIKL